MNNPGVLPKVLVATIRFGMWAEHIRPRILGLPFRLLHRLVELLFCKLLLNCDISVKAEIGQGHDEVCNKNYCLFQKNNLCCRTYQNRRFLRVLSLNGIDEKRG